MSHIDDGQLNALLDGELSLEEARAVEAHVAGCDACRRRLEEARRFLTAASELLSAVVPPAQRFVTPRPTPSGLRTSTPAVAPPPAGTPVAGPPAPPEAVPPAAADTPGATPPRRITKTAKEVAIDIDGATGKSPAIRLFPQQLERHGAAERPAVAPPAPARRRFPTRQLALAATIVLTFAVGYAANDLMQSRDPAPSAESPLSADSNAGMFAARDEQSRKAGPAEPGAGRSRTRSAVAPAATPSRAEERQAGNLRSDAAPVGAGASSAADQRDLAGVGGPATSSRQDEPALRQPRTTPRRETPQPSDAVASAPAATRRAPAAPAARAPSAPPAAQGDTVSRDDLSRMRAAEAANATPAPAPVVTPRTFRRTTLDTAVVRLSGSIRLIDGMDPSRVEIGPGRLVNGAAAEHDVVRIHYTDERGRRFVFDQQRLAPARADAAAGAGEVGLLYGDTIVTTSGTTTRVRWLDSKNFWMSLSGPLPADSLRALVARVR